MQSEVVGEGVERPHTDSEPQTSFLEPRQTDLSSTVEFCRTFFLRRMRISREGVRELP